MDLQNLLDQLTNQPDTNLATLLADMPTDQVKTLGAQVHDAYTTLPSLDGDTDVDEDTVTRLEHLADISDAATTVLASRSDHPDGTADPDPGDNGETDDDDADDGDSGDSDTPQDRRGRAAAAAERLTPTDPDPAPTPTGDTNPAANPHEAPVNTPQNHPEPVAASTQPAQRNVALNQIPGSNNGGSVDGFTTSTARGRTVSYTTQAADIPGLPVGSHLDSVKALANAATARMQGLSRVGPGRSAQAGIATITRNVDPDRLYVNDNDTHVVDQVCNETALPGGSLTAAGCWCAPSETLYDMCPTASVDGLVDLPEVVTQRGGVRYPVVPDFSEIYANAGFHFDCDTIIGDPGADPPVPPAEKPCFEIPCLDMVDNRLDVDGLCIRTPILTERAWPELVEYFLQQALAAHAHRINAWVIAKMVALSTKVDITAQIADLPNPHGPSAMSSVLSIVELYVEHIKLKYRLPENTSLEMVAPRWLRGVLRADLSKRLGVELLQVTDAMLDQYLALRGVRVQWVIDWQCAFAFPSPPPQPPDGIIPPVGTGLGGADYPQAWPNEVQIMLYPAGSLFRMSADVITLDGIYDSVGLSHNEYTRLFTEEGVQVAKRCYEPVTLTIPICGNGGNMAGPRLTCPDPFPTPA